MTLQVWIAFVVLETVLCFTPGPAVLFVVSTSLSRGTRAGLGGAWGIVGCNTFYFLLSALGVAAVILASGRLFTALKWIGAAYLLYLAWGAFRAPVDAAVVPGAAAEADGWRMYRRGVVMNLTNPKVVVFFLAFLPQFADPARGPVAPQLLVLGTVFILATLLVFGAIAVGSGLFGTLLQRSARARRALNWLAGTVFVGLAARLATAQR